MSRPMHHVNWFNEKKCAKCGKVFLAAPEHIYRDKGKSEWYCTWKCFNHKDDEKNKKIKK